ncbi:unnamed protein product [Protopolystoma xenopodis]|uniref:Uncharacterized protein n=1 Tax=Protopolystoma xenopodis TaxID=117903 RepID=A0A3S5AD21_9PLAT|nr:unnamed protein product [Protopolystoma xenopodis]
MTRLLTLASPSSQALTCETDKYISQNNLDVGYLADSPRALSLHLLRGIFLDACLAPRALLLAYTPTTSVSFSFTQPVISRSLSLPRLPTNSLPKELTFKRQYQKKDEKAQPSRIETLALSAISFDKPPMEPLLGPRLTAASPEATDVDLATEFKVESSGTELLSTLPNVISSQSDSSLDGSATLVHVPCNWLARAIADAAVPGLQDPDWIVSNASLQLFAALILRLTGSSAHRLPPPIFEVFNPQPMPAPQLTDFSTSLPSYLSLNAPKAISRSAVGYSVNADIARLLRPTLEFDSPQPRAHCLSAYLCFLARLSPTSGISYPIEQQKLMRDRIKSVMLTSLSASVRHLASVAFIAFLPPDWSDCPCSAADRSFLSIRPDSVCCVSGLGPANFIKCACLVNPAGLQNKTHPETSEIYPSRRSGLNRLHAQLCVLQAWLSAPSVPQAILTKRASVPCSSTKRPSCWYLATQLGDLLSSVLVNLVDHVNTVPATSSPFESYLSEYNLTSTSPFTYSICRSLSKSDFPVTLKAQVSPCAISFAEIKILFTDWLERPQLRNIILHPGKKVDYAQVFPYNSFT